MPAVLADVALVSLLSFFAQPAPESAAPPPPPPATTDSANTPVDHPWHGDERWTMRFEASVWYMGMSGDVQMPRNAEDAGGNDTVDLADLDMDSRSLLTPLGEVDLRKGRWGIAGRGFIYTTDRETLSSFDGRIGEVPVSVGDTIASDLDFNSFEIEGSYRLTPDVLFAMEGKARLRPKLDLVFGMRMLSADWRIVAGSDVSLPPPDAIAQTDEFMVHPLVGLKGSIEIYDQFTIDVKVDGGWLGLGDDTSYGFDILVGGSWKPVPNVGVQVGYRSLFFGMSSGDGDAEFEFTGASQGLYAGLLFEF